MRRQNWPIALAVLFVALLGWYLLYTRQIVRALRAHSERLSQVHAKVMEGINDPVTPSPDDLLVGLQQILLGSRVPMVLTGPGDTIVSIENLPFEADLAIPEDQERIRDYARAIGEEHPPVGDSAIQLVYVGDPPEVRRMRWIPFFQAGGLAITAFLGILSIRVQRRSEAERAWTSMARELAHQLGTPISSLQGWLELLRLPDGERPEEVGQGEIAFEIEADLSRLERISHRFELIGMEPELEAVDLQDTLAELRRYMEVRIPRLAAGVSLDLEVPLDLPPVKGNPVLLTWALENLVKNALDALGGKGGTISIRASQRSAGEVLITVSDTGPGVPLEVRSELFEPGVTTKERGWGVGLALTRRIVEGVHKGRIELGDGGSGGATFHIRMPIWPLESPDPASTTSGAGP